MFDMQGRHSDTERSGRTPVEPWRPTTYSGAASPHSHATEHDPLGTRLHSPHEGSKRERASRQPDLLEAGLSRESQASPCFDSGPLRSYQSTPNGR